MSTADVAILRVAGLPIRLWTAAAAPELFALVRKVNADADEMRARSVTVAERIGCELVVHPDLSAALRARALRVRRALHNGGKVDQADLRTVADTAERMLSADLAAELRDVAERHGRLTADEAALAHAVGAAQRRLLETPWELVRQSPVAWRALRDAHPATLSDVAERVAAGEAWTTKRMRQRADFLWRMIRRGATRATPRGWFAHTVLLPIDGNLPHGPLPPVSAAYAVECSDNLHLRAVNAAPAEPGRVLTMSPLHWNREGRIQFWLIKPEDPTRLHSLQVRATPALQAIGRALAGGGLTAAQLEGALLPDGTDVRQRESLRGFIAHLVELGVIAVSRPPEQRLSGWHDTVAAVPPCRADSYVDVHRRPAARLSMRTCAELQRLIGAAMRVLAVIDLDGRPPTRSDQIGERPRPLLELVAENFAGKPGYDDTEQSHRHDWPVPDDSESPYARLHGWLTSRLDAGPIDLDAAALAAAGVAHVEAEPMTWPIDCHIRPLWTDGEAPLAVLDQLMPTGSYDARFVQALAGLHDDGNARAGWYREFLRLLEERSGGRFVELLVPSLSELAANAVRRPPYTRLWTGDPDARRYYGGTGSSRYVPLADITVRQDGDRRVVEAAGEPIWPVYHATRAIRPPWDVVGALLVDTGPRPSRRRWRSLRYSLTAWPGREFVPRITVGGGALVLTCAQWRLPMSECWPAGDALPGKARALERLRQKLELPRWITVAVNTHDEPRACDLESLQAIHTLDRLRRQGAQALLVSELLPAPTRTPVTDLGAGSPGGSHAELLLRLPVDTDPAAMATLAAAAYRRTNDLSIAEGR